MVSYRFFQKYFRKNARPIPKDDAQMWRERLSKLYLFLGFNILGLIAYASYQEDLELIPKDKGYNKIQRFSRLAHGEKVHVIEFKGLQKTEEYVLTKDDV